jgi:hypothetical protein
MGFSSMENLDSETGTKKIKKIEVLSSDSEAEEDLIEPNRNLI